MQVIASGVAEVIAGAHHSYALRSSDGQVLSWGRNYRNELGDGTDEDQDATSVGRGVSGARRLDRLGPRPRARGRWKTAR